MGLGAWRCGSGGGGGGGDQNGLFISTCITGIQITEVFVK